MFRDAGLVAGTSLDLAIRARTGRGMPRPVVIGAGLVATGAVLALAHVAGADVRGWLAPGQSGLVPGLLEAFSDENAQTRARTE